MFNHCHLVYQENFSKRRVLKQWDYELRRLIGASEWNCSRPRAAPECWPKKLSARFLSFYDIQPKDPPPSTNGPEKIEAHHAAFFYCLG